MSISDEMLAALARRSRHAGLLTAAGVVVVVGALGFSVWQLHDLESRKAQLAADIASLTQQKQTLSTQVATLRTKSDAQGDVIASAQLKIAAGETPAAAKVLAGSPTPTAVVKRVYFQARSPDQAAIFKRCAGVLVAKGYRVPKLELVSDAGPQRTSIRYFRPEDRDEAGQLASDLGGCAGTDFRLSAIGGYAASANVKPHQFEVWFAPDLQPPVPEPAPVAQAVNPRLVAQQAQVQANAPPPYVQQSVKQLPPVQQQKAR